MDSDALETTPLMTSPWELVVSVGEEAAAANAFLLAAAENLTDGCMRTCVSYFLGDNIHSSTLA